MELILINYKKPLNRFAFFDEYTEEIDLTKVDAEIGDLFLDKIPALCKSLKTISLTRCSGFSEAGLIRFFSSFSFLENVSLSGCLNVTDRVIGRSLYCPNCFLKHKLLYHAYISLLYPKMFKYLMTR
jgi:hypothetical protein